MKERVDRMEMQLTTQTVSEIECSALVVGVLTTPSEQEARLTPSAQAVDAALGGVISQSCARGIIRGEAGQITTFYTLGRLPAERVVVLGLGALNGQEARTLRRTCACVARALQETGVSRLALALTDAFSDSSLSAAAAVQAQIEGCLLGLYRFQQYKTGQRGKPSDISAIMIVSQEGPSEELTAALERGRIMAEGTNFARDLVNEPPNVLTPAELARRAHHLAETWNLEYEVLERPQMEALGMGGLLAVSSGSGEPPYLVILRYRGAPTDHARGIALVGKGITFDSGGLSLKTQEGMVTMKGDMAGAAAVLGAMQIIARLKPAVNVTALVPTTENMTGSRAYRPGDILRLMNGKTIEIVNTDAEGRLILADAMSYAAREGLSPIIDVATLTGGIHVALGTVYTGLFSNDHTLSQELIAAGQTVGEKLWEMPLDEEYSEQIRSEIADIKQTGGRPASAITAAKILEHFAGAASWAHLDIAGTSFSDSPKPYQEKGATGIAVRTLAAFVLRRGAAG
jgi:leucyl aminopeptidase